MRCSPFVLAALPLLLAAVLLNGCERPAPPAPPTPAPPPAAPATNQPDTKTFFVQGVIEELPPGGKTARINHEEIPGYMAAMTMLLKVKDTNELSAVKVGDKVLFRMLVTEDEGWIDQVRIIKRADGTIPSAVPHTRPVRNVTPLVVGDALPNYPFTNQWGKLFHTADFKGQALAITFIFTRCPFPDFCPRMSKNFAEAHRLLSARTGGPTNWHLLSLSFDVEFDTPAALARYSKMYSGDSPKWTFASGAIIEIDDITERFGLVVVRQSGGVNFDHNLRTVVVDARGRVHHVFTGNEWQPEELAEKMVEATGVSPEDAPAAP